MEYSNIPSPSVRIGDLLSVYDKLPREFFVLGEANAASVMQDELHSLISDHKLLEQLQEDCSLNNLFVEEDHASLDYVLNVIPTRTEDLFELKTLFAIDSLKKRSEKPSIDLSFKNIAEESPDATELLRDVMVTVLVHRPVCFSKLDISTQPRYLCVSQRIVVLGSQLLSDLKDSIRCPQDKVWLGDCSEALDDTNLHISADHLYKSSYFFIENTFYDDLRNPNNLQLSQPVLDWLKSKSEFQPLGPFQMVPMEKARVADLVICLGKPYYYIHQGNCDHVIIFSDIRLIDRDLCQSDCAFPMLTGRCQVRPVRCTACRRLYARWVASNAGDLLPSDPCALCDVCLRLLLYDKDGKKIRPSFTVHMYCGDEVIVQP